MTINNRALPISIACQYSLRHNGTLETLLRKSTKGNLHFMGVHKLNGLLNSALLYTGIVGLDEKSVGIEPNKVGVVVVDDDKGI
jgi:hypothetical protein